MGDVMKAISNLALWRHLVPIGTAACLVACAADPGAAGKDGASCTLTDKGGGVKEIKCGDSPPITISDGAAGKDGKAGIDGKNGQDGTAGKDGAAGAAGKDGAAGAAGKDGAPCDVKDNGNGTKTVTCGSYSVTLSDGATGTAGKNGADGKPCEVKDNGNGTKTITCAGITVDLPAGPTGTTGPAGPAGAAAKPCTVTDGGMGLKTIVCADGSKVTVADGAIANDWKIDRFHGIKYMQTSGNFKTNGKVLVKAVITDASADVSGKVVVKFKVNLPDKSPGVAGDPITALTSLSSNIAKLVPAGNGDASSKWVPYIQNPAAVTATTATAGPWPNPAGYTVYQAGSDSWNVDPTKGGTLVNNNDGTYVYTYLRNIAAVKLPALTSPVTPEQTITYDRSAKHRIQIMMGGSTGPTANAVYDFIPDGSTTNLAMTRDIVDTETCKNCHGWDFRAHGGNRLEVDGCTNCHNPSTTDPQSGNTVDMKVMVHKIHAGSHLASIKGADGKVFNDPATAEDESADNGKYYIWGNSNSKWTWWKVGFPAETENCEKCHQGKAPQADNWKKVYSRAACGSCHDTVNWTDGTGHKGGKQLSDDNCTSCHQAGGLAVDTVDAHNWTVKDFRNIPEFTAKVTVSTPKNGTHFVAGEAPVVTIQLTDENGKLLDHTTIEEDSAAETCPTASAKDCTPRDGKFRTAALFVHGPRSNNNPVLTTAARAQIFSTTAGPWDLSSAATGTTFQIKIDGGRDLWSKATPSTDNSIIKPFDTYQPGNITLTTTATTFANKAAVTPADFAKWLNANAQFKARAIAWVDGASGKLGIRSRNLGVSYSVQLQAGLFTTAIFNGDTAYKSTTGFTPGNNCSKRLVATNEDPKVTRTADAITYQLDPVDDLRIGTYTADIEFADRGNTSGTDYKTPTVARATFQVGSATPEKPVADGCANCHQHNGKGLVVDARRHNKALEDDAMDRCGSCHDYQSQNPVGLDWSGARPISKRIHAIHYGSKLNFPNQTVWYGNGDPTPGRNWDITLPQDVRNCEACHSSKTSGTWATNPNRLACWGCHDSLSTQAHFKTMTYDPTPLDAYSGDEVESCKNCH